MNDEAFDQFIETLRAKCRVWLGGEAMDMLERLIAHTRDLRRALKQTRADK